MKLSIITINFNDRDGLEKTIQSVINQTFQDFEYIVVDGASTDGSVDVIKKYSDRLTHWVSEPDSGIYNAMNKGTQMASGDYCLYLNSGDFLADNDVIEKAFNYNFSEDLVSCNCLNFDTNHEWLHVPPRQITLYTFCGGSLPHPTTFIKRDLLNRLGGYNESYRIMSDWCFFLDATIKYQCSYRSLDLLLSKFNCYGISSTQSSQEGTKAINYLHSGFPRIIDDYIPYENEAVYNVFLWIKDKTLLKHIIVFPFKVINRIFKLRNRLGIRMGIYLHK